MQMFVDQSVGTADRQLRGGVKGKYQAIDELRHVKCLLAYSRVTVSLSCECVLLSTVFRQCLKDPDILKYYYVCSLCQSKHDYL